MSTTTISTPKESTVHLEPLKSVLALTDLPVSSLMNGEVFPEAPAALEIEHWVPFDRLGAAGLADLFVFRCLGQLETRGRTPFLTERLLSAVGAWAKTRFWLGLDEGESPAMDWVLAQVRDCPGTAAFARAYRRSGRLKDDVFRVSSPGVLLKFRRMLSREGCQDLLSALLESSVLEGAETELGGVHLDFGRRSLFLEEPKRARDFLRMALCRLKDPREIFEAHFLIAKAWLLEQRPEDAAMAAENLLTTEPPQRHQKLHLEAEIHQALGSPDQSLECRLQALRLSAGLCGMERRLEDLLVLNGLGAELPEIVLQTLEELKDSVDRPDWIEQVEQLESCLRNPDSLPDELSRCLRRELLLSHQDRVLNPTDPDLTEEDTSCSPPTPLVAANEI